MNSLVKGYIEILRAELSKVSKLGLIIWGSAGSDRFTMNSDLDLWLVAPEKLSFDEMFSISQMEHGLRKTYGKRFGLQNFARHRASIFSRQEADAFLKGFYWRYYLSLSMFGEAVMFDFVPSKYTWTTEELHADMVATLQERMESTCFKQKSTALSFNERDFSYYKKQIEVPVVAEPMNTIQSFLERQSRNPELEVASRRQTHTILWTLEKVRWELFNSYADPEYFQKWKTGTHEGYGYSLLELGDLLFQLAQSGRLPITETFKALGKNLTQLLHSETAAQIPQVYAIFTEVFDELLFESKDPISSQTHSITLPLSGYQEAVVCKLSNDPRYIISEHEGQRLFSQEPPKTVSLGKVSYVVSAYKPGVVATQHDGKVLAKLLKKVHTHQGEFFGRTGMGPHFAKFSDYLLHRLEKVTCAGSLTRAVRSLIDKHVADLDAIRSVACHMDANPENILLHEGRATLIDWEQFSYCAKEWDIERSLLDAEEQTRKEMYTEYYGSPFPESALVTLLTRLVITLCRAQKDLIHREILLTSSQHLLHELQNTISRAVLTGSGTDTAHRDSKKNGRVHRKHNRAGVVTACREIPAGI